MGQFIQVSDDLGDALEIPARADWRRPTNNLALLFASTAEHPERERFEQLASHVYNDEAALAAAQEILVRCGAVSYCVLKMTELSTQANEWLARTPLADRKPIETLLASQARPLARLLRRAGFSMAEALAPN
jgi:geranylgeranyl pyrophosphate synthase